VKPPYNRLINLLHTEVLAVVFSVGLRLFIEMLI
jgi:hypothetical protein